MNKKEKMNYVVALELTILAIVFSIMTMTIDVKYIGPMFTKVGLASMNKALHDSIGVNYTFYNISQILGYMAILIAGIFAFIGLTQWIKRKNLLKVDKTIFALGGLFLITIMLYVLFEKLAINYRPIIMPGEISPEASFPSSHTMLAIVVFGSAAIVLDEYIKNNKIALALKIILIVLMIVTIISRLLSGVHWVSDIIAGIIISAALIQIFYSLIYTIKRK